MNLKFDISLGVTADSIHLLPPFVSFGASSSHLICLFIESHNHRIVWVGGDFKALPAPTPCHGLVVPHQLRLPRSPSNLALSTSRDGAPQLLWAAVPGPHRPLSKILWQDGHFEKSLRYSSDGNFCSEATSVSHLPIN